MSGLCKSLQAFAALRQRNCAQVTETGRISSSAVNNTAFSSDQESVLITQNDLLPELRLIARSEDAPEKTVCFLTGAIAACGGQMLSRRFHSDGSAGLECEFPRAICVEMYGVLLAAGLHLSRSSHLKMAELCRCTHALPRDFERQVVMLEVEVLKSTAEDESLRQPLEWRQIA